jgi:hypothetical protein
LGSDGSGKIMKNALTFIKRTAFTEKSAPLAFLIACILGFGLLIPKLGFYMDDWPYVFYAYNKGIGSLREMLLYDSRPYAAWLYILAFKTLGFKPIYWHITALLMRWVTVLLLWKTLTAIWPKRIRETTTIALLFAVYPFFMLQPFAVGSTHHWVGFIFFNLSLYLMVLAFQHNKYAIWLTLAAVILQAAHLFTSEYFAGLELLRPVIFWILISRNEVNIQKKLWKVFLRWLPYILILGIFAYWRTAVFQNIVGSRNTPVILHQLFTEPFKAIGFLMTASIKDAVSVMTIGWQSAMSADLLNFDSVFTRYRLLMSAISFGLAFIYLSKLRPSSGEDNPADNWSKESILLAVVGLMVAGLPIWLIGRYILESKNLLSASRFGIPTMLGAAFLLVLIINYFVSDRKKNIILLSLCLALAVNFHLDNTKEFQGSWEKQVRLARELIWRAPQIKAGTSILTDEEVLGIMGDYAVSFSINTTYQVKNIKNTPPLWYFPFYYTNPNIGDLLKGAPLEYSKLSMNFSGNSKQMLLLSFNPEMKRCLWIMQPQDTNLRLVSDDMRKLSAGSDINLIQQTATEPTLPESIYGKQNTQTWCYYFEKADLARQYGQWDEIARLWKESQSAGERADNGFEYIPFIEGFGYLEDWEYVKTQTKFADKITAGLEPSLCSALDRLAANAPASAQRDETIKNLKDDLKCKNYQ